METTSVKSSSYSFLGFDTPFGPNYKKCTIFERIILFALENEYTVSTKADLSHKKREKDGEGEGQEKVLL